MDTHTSHVTPHLPNLTRSERYKILHQETPQDSSYARMKSPELRDSYSPDPCATSPASLIKDCLIKRMASGQRRTKEKSATGVNVEQDKQQNNEGAHVLKDHHYPWVRGYP